MLLTLRKEISKTQSNEDQHHLAFSKKVDISPPCTVTVNLSDLYCFSYLIISRLQLQLIVQICTKLKYALGIAGIPAINYHTKTKHITEFPAHTPYGESTSFNYHLEQLHKSTDAPCRMPQG